MYATAIVAFLYNYDLELKAFSAMPTKIMNICGKL